MFVFPSWGKWLDFYTACFVFVSIRSWYPLAGPDKVGKQASAACRHRPQFVGTGRKEKRRGKKGKKEKKGKKRKERGKKEKKEKKKEKKEKKKRKREKEKKRKNEKMKK